MVFSAPYYICFADDPIVYRLTDCQPLTAVELVFSIGTSPEVHTITIACIADAQGLIEVDIADIIRAYCPNLQLNTLTGSITGGVEFRLTTVGQTAVTDDDHLAIRGSISTFDTGKAENIYTAIVEHNTLPFLSHRRINDSTIHYYRSELRYADIFALASNDNGLSAVTNEGNSMTVYSRYGSIKVLSGDTLFTGYRYGSSGYHIHPRYRPYKEVECQLNDEEAQTLATYTVKIDPDPETDEIYIFRFVNSYGVTDAVLVPGEMTKQTETETPPTYLVNNFYHQNKAYQRRKLTKRYPIQTAHLEEYQIRLIEDMLQSDKVEIIIEDTPLQCIVTTQMEYDFVQHTPRTVKLDIEILQQPTGAWVSQNG